VETPAGEWWAVFLGTRNYGRDLWNTGRETFLLPVTWVDGWPVMLTGKTTVPYTHVRPNLPAQPSAPVPHSGNFTFREEFDGRALAPYWVMLRTPREQWVDLTTAPGSLILRARTESLSGVGQPSLVLRRQQHGSASVSTAMRYAPARAGDKAGLVAFHNEAHYYFLGVVHDGTRPMIQLLRRAGRDATADSVLASEPLSGPPSGPVYLRIRARDGHYDFFYATEPDAWKPLLQNADGTILSTKVAGGFVGTMFGMYAYGGTR
jgi:alpha-N-arabinofuranosidase